MTTLMSQRTLQGDDVLDVQVAQSLTIIKKAARKSGLTPLVVNFSGGKDSLVLLDLVQQITTNFVCSYMVSGIEFKEAVSFARKVCSSFGRPLLLSYPKDHKGTFFDRIAVLKKFPTVRSIWCNRDLKIRPQKKMLVRRLGYRKYFKLNGVRRFESTRRRRIHINTPRKGFMFPDYQVSRDIMVFPILNWKNEEIREKVRIPKNPLYDKYGVSGCYWCPFYQPSIFKCIMEQNSDIYDPFIEWERKLGQPSINGFRWLRDLKKDLS